MNSVLLQLLENKNLLPLASIRQGVERECLRVDSKARLASTDHDQRLGSKLTHPFITTDYSENLLEYITGVYSDERELSSDLEKMHSFTYQNIDSSEVIWPMSMPAIVPENENDIKVAHYGTSNTGRLKELYRTGLGHRYGKSMQSIAGVHYNFSMTDEFWHSYGKLIGISDLTEIKNTGYFHLIRNYRRYSSLLVYLFGATPAVDESFLKNKKHKLKKLGSRTWGLENATSLRMGGLGYTSNAQEDISICYNALSTYIETLEQARLKSYPEYEKIGVKDHTGYKQLNTNLLQIDNEFYSTIRPKNIARSGQSALGALFEKGIEYIEVRLLDVNPFNPIGVDLETMRFLHSFLLFCLFEESPTISKQECDEIDENFSNIVNFGRDKNLELVIDGKSVSREAYFDKLLNKINLVSKLLDESYNTCDYNKTTQIQIDKNLDIEKLPSSKIHNLYDDNKSLIEEMFKIATHYKEHLSVIEFDSSWNDIAKKSIKAQKDLEQEDENFEDFLVRYFEEIKIKF